MTDGRKCWCGSLKLFSECCRPFLSGKLTPGTPEALMRSRFSAFCEKNINYLMATAHPSTRRPDDCITLERTCQTTQWLGLKIIKSAIDRTDSFVGFVEFAAFYRAGDAGQLHEQSRFVRENGRWYYMDGRILPPLEFKRSQPCWCGSGKKYKRCHGK